MSGGGVRCHYCDEPGDLIEWPSASGYKVLACRNAASCTARAERRLAARVNEAAEGLRTK